MKKLKIIILSTVVVISCSALSGNSKSEFYTKDNMSNNYNFSDNQNDLVYHDYDNAIKISYASRLIFSIDSYVNNEISYIYAFNLEKNKLYEIGNLPNSESLYKIVAVLNSGEYIDITSKVLVESEIVDKKDNKNGIILLR